jgi:hypothetical protein
VIAGLPHDAEGVQDSEGGVLASGGTEFDESLDQSTMVRELHSDGVPSGRVRVTARLNCANEADLDRANGSGRWEVRRARSDRCRLLQRLPNLRHHKHHQRGYCRGRWRGVRRGELRQAAARKPFVSHASSGGSSSRARFAGQPATARPLRTVRDPIQGVTAAEAVTPRSSSGGTRSMGASLGRLR